VLERAVRVDERLRDTGEQDRIDDKTVFIVKRSETNLAHQTGIENERAVVSRCLRPHNKMAGMLAGH
jgi:hypothetical protein